MDFHRLWGDVQLLRNCPVGPPRAASSTARRSLGVRASIPAKARYRGCPATRSSAFARPGVTGWLARTMAMTLARNPDGSPEELQVLDALQRAEAAAVCLALDGS